MSCVGCGLLFKQCWCISLLLLEVQPVYSHYCSSVCRRQVWRKEGGGEGAGGRRGSLSVRRSLRTAELSLAWELAQGSADVSGCAGHAAPSVLEEAWRLSKLSVRARGVINPTNPGDCALRGVLVVPVAGGCCHQCLFFPCLLCDPHRSVIKRGKAERKELWPRDAALARPAWRAGRSPSSPVRGKSNPRKLG